MTFVVLLRFLVRACWGEAEKKAEHRNSAPEATAIDPNHRPLSTERGFIFPSVELVAPLGLLTSIRLKGIEFVRFLLI